jgi:hypothetical protein
MPRLLPWAASRIETTAEIPLHRCRYTAVWAVPRGFHYH